MSHTIRTMALGLSTVVIFLFLALDPASATRLALVLGNSKYQNVPTLENPANDAQDLAASLRQLGFDVIEQHDASREAMAQAVHDFSDRLPGATVALFFYAGHGLQMNGENYLVPVDAKIQNAADIRFNTINLSDIQGEMEGSGRTSIIILDACRDNPFADKLAASGRGLGTRGLGRMEAAAQGSLIVYSTQPNNVALDGAGRNSPFTAALLKHVTTPGLEVRQMISRVRGDVLTATDNKQTPWDSSSLVGDVYLASAPDAPKAQAVAAPTPAVLAPSAPRQTPAPETVAPEAVAAAETECERLADYHVRTSMAAKEKTATDWTHVVAVCQAELAAHPGEPRFLYALGRAQEQAKNYAEALRDLRTAVDAGNVEALVDLGQLYYSGHGVLQSYPTAFADFSKAAAAGSSRALGNVASMYGNGFGVAKDPAKALDLAEKSIEAGNPFGLRIVANHYFNGSGVPRDFQMAAQYLQQSVDLGDGQAMKFLANMYESGYLGPPDAAKASELRLQAERVDPDSLPPSPEHLPLLHQTAAASAPVVHRRRYVLYRPAYMGQPVMAGGQSYNPAWQAAPGDTSCCPNNLLICPTPRHFCPR